MRVQWRDNVEIPFTGYVTLPLQLGTNPDIQLDVPHLVTSEQLLHAIIGLNVVRVIADSHPKHSLVNVFRSAIVNKNEDQIKSFAEVLRVAAENSHKSEVKRRGGDIILEAGKRSHNLCRANLGFLDERRPMIFQQSQFKQPQGVCCMVTVVTLATPIAT